MSKRPTKIAHIEGQEIPLLPLSGALLLPHTQRPLMIFEPRYIALIEHILGTSRVFGLIQPQNDEEESPKSNNTDLKKIGALGYLRAFEEQEDGKFAIVLDGLCRFDLVEEVKSSFPFRVAKIDVKPYAQDFNTQYGHNEVNRDEFLTLLRAYSKFANFQFDWEGLEKLSIAQLVNICCVMSPYGAVEKQALLEANSLNQRAQTLIALAEMEMATAKATHPGSEIQ